MESMKIYATVINDLTYDQRMIRICTSLADAGHDVVLVGRTLAKSKLIIPQKFKQKRLRCWFNKGKLFYLEYNIRLFFFLLFQKFDVVCSVDLDTILAAYVVCKIKGKTQVYDAHEYFTEVPEVVGRPNVQKVWEQVAQFTIPKIDYCYTVCESLADIFQEKYQSHFEVIRNVNYRKQVKNNSSNIFDFSSSKVFLYQGALNEGRGLEATIAAMQGIENAQLWLAGEGDLSQGLRQLVKEKRVEDKVRFLGYVLPKDLPELTQKAFVGLNLLENKGLSYYYSLANKTFDYMQAGLPALHMNFPEYQKINAQYEVALLLDDLEIETIQQAFNRLLSDEHLYIRLQENCRKAAPEFCWEKEEKKLIQFYQKLKLD